MLITDTSEGEQRSLYDHLKTIFLCLYSLELSGGLMDSIRKSELRSSGDLSGCFVSFCVKAQTSETCFVFFIWSKDRRSNRFRLIFKWAGCSQGGVYRRGVNRRDRFGESGGSETDSATVWVHSCLFKRSVCSLCLWHLAAVSFTLSWLTAVVVWIRLLFGGALWRNPGRLES